LKERLAYSTISQLSYMLIGAFTLHTFGLVGSVFHMLSHSLLKITFFFCAGIVMRQTGKTLISQMRGVGRQLPATMSAFAIASLGMVGMLPLNAFWSKYYLMKGTVAAGSWYLSLILVATGILNAFCFIPIVISAFSGREGRQREERGTGSQVCRSFCWLQ
jgi:multicomponent Na+:H+ antiporter subunit D